MIERYAAVVASAAQKEVKLSSQLDQPNYPITSSTGAVSKFTPKKESELFNYQTPQNSAAYGVGLALRNSCEAFYGSITNSITNTFYGEAKQQQTHRNHVAKIKCARDETARKRFFASDTFILFI